MLSYWYNFTPQKPGEQFDETMYIGNGIQKERKVCLFSYEHNVLDWVTESTHIQPVISTAYITPVLIHTKVILKYEHSSIILKCKQ